MSKGKIVWADDEIDLLRPHIMFLEEKGYTVVPVLNGDDSIEVIKQGGCDVLLLDENMPGKDGLETLSEIREVNPNIPVIMITKSEEEALMESALGGKITDYLTKPVNPSQILLACKKVLERRKIESARISKDYIAEFNKISQKLMESLTPEDWFEIHSALSQWDLELDNHPETGLQQTLNDQKRECNVEFGKYVERHYEGWVNHRKDSPELSVDIVKNHILPGLRENQTVVFFVIDCLRLDQWLCLEPMLQSYFEIKKDYYFSILPTATPYSRNALFSGLFPLEIEQQLPDIWEKGEEDENSKNRNERQLLDRLLAKHQINLKPEPRYVKVLDIEEAKSVEKNILNYLDSKLVSIVVNFLDILAHSRSDSSVLKEIAPDESAYRTLTKSWFKHSPLFETLKKLAREDCKVVITSDHGSIRSLHATKVIGDKETSTSLRYKHGRSLKCNYKDAIFLRDPRKYMLPLRGVNTNYIIAKEDYYFVYPTNYHYYLNYYKDSFQHGGVSLEEMVMPVIEMVGKK